MTAPLILLPPSEGKADGGTGAPWAPGSMAVDLDGRREKVLDALVKSAKWSAVRRQKLLGVKGDALAAATVRLLRVFLPVTDEQLAAVAHFATPWLCCSRASVTRRSRSWRSRTARPRIAACIRVAASSASV
jgi:hypothetical protein